jgi:hypothetical protein
VTAALLVLRRRLARSNRHLHIPRLANPVTHRFVAPTFSMAVGLAVAAMWKSFKSHGGFDSGRASVVMDMIQKMRWMRVVGEFYDRNHS